MVVLEGGGMLSSSANQYLQPDYLSPLPTTLDAKKSPLALLAQTCSQIGADTPNSKPLISPMDKPKKSSSENRASPAAARDKDKSASRSSPLETKLAFKPYENVTTPKKSEDTRPTSKSSIQNLEINEDRKSDRKSVSPSNSSAATPAPETGKVSPTSSDRKSSTPSARGASPIIRSGLEILQGHAKDAALSSAYKPGSLSGLSGGLGGPLSSLCCPPGLEHTNPAFRPPFPGGPFSHHHAAMLGYPGATPGPYLSYARVKTPSGGEALVPVCKDPYCTGCQFSMHNQQLLMAGAGTSGPCPSGCTQCDHQKYNLAMAMSLVPPGPVPSSLAYQQLGRPYVCNWIAGDTYCGKRFVTSDELLQHLRTHTSGTDTSSVATTVASSLLNPHSLFSTSALHRYPNPPLSPLSAARYHPYAKPTLPSSLAASPYSAFNPTALGPYYSPYSVYGQRLGAAAVHP
ncbi:zinc-finger protein nolz1-related [Holotrichia oblita]|uniref:Zinc-finger protein nolz1-related n=1 Tax=Holotrichia oblita TaxID=644536 RepID=A0ACB9SYA6_HOLOL|nr:zinc-finger protein nolz1-related [Holotrichia oblita]